ncbi:hypothetical protein BOX15_Mlig012379g1, partial [Macrostomum lignano]
QWNADRMASAINSGLICFDSGGVCELQTPTSTPIAATASVGAVTNIPVTSSPRRPASAVPWQSATLSSPSSLSKLKNPMAASADAAAGAGSVKDDSLVELLARVQGSRMDDQRGKIDARNLELPAFLRVGAQTNSNLNKPASEAATAVKSIANPNIIPGMRGQDKENSNVGNSVAKCSPHRPLRGRRHQPLKASPNVKLTPVHKLGGGREEPEFESVSIRSSTPSPTTHLLVLASPDSSSLLTVDNDAGQECGYEYKADRV